jgi:hypothetical protein
LPDRTSAITGAFRLELGGQSLPVNSVEGGGAVGVVVTSPSTGGSFFQEKHLAGVRYESIAIGASFGSARPLFELIKTAWQGMPTQNNGAVLRVGANGRPLARREFVKAVIAETIIPKLDGASNSPAFVTVRLAPELTRDVAPPATLPPAGPAPAASLSSNFRLNIAGLDCNRVAKIDSFTVKQRITSQILDNVHYQVDQTPVAPANRLEFPNLRIELASGSAESWRSWFKSFVIDGNSSAMNEKTGTLSFLAPNLSTVLATISFQNLGIFRLEDVPPEGSAEVTRLVAELYCERMEFVSG